MESAYFAGGCFWCVTPIFQELDGVENVISGYSGGDEINPKYEDVKHQLTGHREAIEIVYDPNKVSYSTLFHVFLDNVDPFDDGGQFIDRGFSYTLAVFFRTESEKECALAAISKLETASGKRVYISVEPFKNFFDAEEYHQNYYLKHPDAFEKELIESGRKKYKESM